MGGVCPVLARERYQAIKQLIIKDKKVFIPKLSEQFQVTEETIRRDLDKLELDGVATKVCGGAVLNAERINENIPFFKCAYSNAEEKRYIATRAVELIEEQMTIGTDCSSTAMELVKLIQNREDLTLFTNSSEVLREFSQSEIHILSTGGIFNRKSLSLQGTIAKSAIKSYNVDIAFISCKGINMEKGLLDTYEAEAELKTALVEQASKVALLVDHSKFDRTAFIKFIDYSDLDYVVTDQKPSKEWMDFFQKRAIQIIY